MSFDKVKELLSASAKAEPANFSSYVLNGPSHLGPHGEKTLPPIAHVVTTPTIGMVGGFYTGMSQSEKMQSKLAKVIDDSALPYAERKAALDASKIFGSGKFVYSEVGKGLLKGTAATAADVGINMTLQNQFGHNIGGHDLFRTTFVEGAAMAAVASFPMPLCAKVSLAGAVWLGTRIGNYNDYNIDEDLGIRY